MSFFLCFSLLILFLIQSLLSVCTMLQWCIIFIMSVYFCFNMHMFVIIWCRTVYVVLSIYFPVVALYQWLGYDCLNVFFFNVGFTLMLERMYCTVYCCTAALSLYTSTLLLISVIVYVELLFNSSFLCALHWFDFFRKWLQINCILFFL